MSGKLSKPALMVASALILVASETGRRIAITGSIGGVAIRSHRRDFG
ncbi:MAG: hypothetical protein ABGW81_11100 [Paracoccaceae bacterium]